MFAILNAVLITLSGILIPWITNQSTGSSTRYSHNRMSCSYFQFDEGSYKVRKINDQDTTDFDKALKFITETDTSNVSVVALNCFGGRLDHTLAILNSTYRFETTMDTKLKVQLMNESCLARIIHAVTSPLLNPSLIST